MCVLCVLCVFMCSHIESCYADFLLLAAAVALLCRIPVHHLSVGPAVVLLLLIDGCLVHAPLKVVRLFALWPLTGHLKAREERFLFTTERPRTPCVLMRSEFGGSFIKPLMSCWTISRRAFVSCQSRFKPMSSSQCSGLHPLIRWHCVYVQLFICDSCKYLNLPTFNDYWRETIREGVKSTWLTTALSNHL